MSDLFWSAEAPANIALIKYMGKKTAATTTAPGSRNRPTNSSLSMTLNHLFSRVEIHSKASGEANYDTWAPLNLDGFLVTNLSESGRRRYLAHFEFLKQKLAINGSFEVRSANNFPSDCGVASSASSFAALTLAAYRLAQSQHADIDMSLNKIAEHSRIGSGSSIRSFMGPFVRWDEAGVAELCFSKLDLVHQLVIVDREKKAIGSSEAHRFVTTSPQFKGRPERAEQRLTLLVNALNKGDWRTAYEISWAEFWDMHSLFSTSVPPFEYMNELSHRVLNFYAKKWQETGDGPLITMDAGANVHLLYRYDQIESAKAWALESGFEFLNDPRIVKSNLVQRSPMGDEAQI